MPIVMTSFMTSYLLSHVGFVVEKNTEEENGETAKRIQLPEKRDALAPTVGVDANNFVVLCQLLKIRNSL